MIFFSLSNILIKTKLHKKSFPLFSSLPMHFMNEDFLSIKEKKRIKNERDQVMAVISKGVCW